jgi:hypothetical protein
MKFIQSLSESRLLSSTSAYHKFTGRQVAELVYLHVLALRILASEKLTKHFAADYSARSIRYNGFAKWYQNATDLHLLIHALMSDEVELKLPQSSQAFRETLYFDEQEIRYWVRDISHSRINESRTHRLFLHLDGQFQIKDGSMKAIRRLVQDWPTIGERQKQLAMTRLLQMLRVRSRQSDLLVELEKLATKMRLELRGVDNPETGDVVKHDGSDPHFVEKPKNKSMLKTIAAKASGGTTLGYSSINSLREGAVVHRDDHIIVVESPSVLQIARLKEAAGHEGVRVIVQDDKLFAWDGAHLTFAEAAKIVGDGVRATLWEGYVEAHADADIDAIWNNESLRHFYEGAAPVMVGEDEELIIEDDGGAGATCAGDVAAVTSLFGPVRRRKRKGRAKRK